MQSVLHITNGDAFSTYFNNLEIQGTVITWREMLCEGRTLHQVGTEAFWKERYEFLNKNYKVTKKSFIDLTLKEYRKLCKQKKQDQIVLWFESDLFCQINMLGVLSWLKTHRRNVEISVVSNPISTNNFSAKGFCELEPEILQSLYENRQVLTQDDIEFVDYAWQLYCSNNPVRIAQLSNYEDFNFPYLKQAFELHLERFPSLKNGLNAQENLMLSTALANSFSSKNALVKEIIQKQGNLGFGDSQYFKTLENLESLFNSFEPIKLKRIVSKILSGEQNYYSKIKDPNLYLGGALKYAYLYNEEQKSFLKL